jgi:hypothetical protein
MTVVITGCKAYGRVCVCVCAGTDTPVHTRKVWFRAVGWLFILSWVPLLSRNREFKFLGAVNLTVFF